MNILLLTHRVPYPPNRGDRIRAYHLLRFLAQRHQVSLGCLADEPVTVETESKLKELTSRLEVIPHHSKLRWARAALSFASGLTATRGLFASSKLAETILRWNHAERFDCIVAFCSSMAPYALAPELRSVPLLVDLVDVDSEKWLEYQRRTAGPKSWLYGIEGRRLRVWEQQLTQTARKMVLVSQDEVDLFQSFCPTAQIEAIGNGVEVDYFQPAVEEHSQPESCVFVGALDYVPNIDALEWFCRAVWPGLLNRRPHAQLTIVGRRPKPGVLALEKLSGVRVEADVADVRPFVDQAQVAIAPLRIARGIQNKVLEALAQGKPVVASTGALTGLSIDPGRHALRADTAEEWIDSLLRLWDSSEDRQRLGRQGRLLVESQYRWEAALGPWSHLIQDCCTSPEYKVACPSDVPPTAYAPSGSGQL